MKDLKTKIVQDLSKAKQHLEYSYKKSQALDLNKPLSEENLETLESFAGRFARYSDLIIQKYFRLLLKEQDPAYSGTVIDTLNAAEKNGWIGSAESFKKIRELRNVAAHEYSPEEYLKLYEEFIRLCPLLIRVSISL